MSTLHYRELRERSIDLLLGRIPTPFTEDDLEAALAQPGQRRPTSAYSSAMASIT
jgi:hypothetical protein